MLCLGVLVCVLLTAIPAFAAEWIVVDSELVLVSSMYFEPSYYASGATKFPSNANQYVVDGDPLLSGPEGIGRGPHGGYTTASSKCGVCHAVHSAYASSASAIENSHLTRGAGGCEYCHLNGSIVGNPLSAKVVYTGGVEGGPSNLEKGNAGERSGHEISGEPVIIPASSDEQEITLSCSTCHMVHGVTHGWMPTDFWGAEGQFGNNETTADSGYKLLRANPGGGANPVPNAVSGAIGAPAVDPAQVNQYTMSVWCESCHDAAVKVQSATSEETSFTANTTKDAKGWHATDPLATNLPEGSDINGPHSTVLTGVYSGPGQCYTCHRGGLPADPDAEAPNALAPFNRYRGLGYYQVTSASSPAARRAQQQRNLKCSRCHFGTADYAFFSPGSDWPHMSNDGGASLLGDWTRNRVAGDGDKPGDAVPVLSSVPGADFPGNATTYACQRCHIRPDNDFDVYFMSHRVPDHTFNFLEFKKSIGRLGHRYSPGHKELPDAYEPLANITSFEVKPRFCTLPVNNGSTHYNIATAPTAQTYNFTTTTVGIPEPGDTIDTTAVWSVDSVAASLGFSVTGGPNTGTVTIPANAPTGTYTVTAKAAQDLTKSVSFTIYVGSLAEVVDAVIMPPTTSGAGSGSHEDSTFFANGTEWRVIAKNSDLSEVLILAEHVMGSAVMWNPTNDTTGGYEASQIRNVDLADIYKYQLQWAHDYAMLPTINAGWTAVNNTTEISTSSGVLVKDRTDGGGYLDGCFLLSYNDLLQLGYGFDPVANKTDNARIDVQITQPGVGTARAWWLRTPSTGAAVRYVQASGDASAGAGANFTAYLRPAMFLNLASGGSGIEKATAPIEKSSAGLSGSDLGNNSGDPELIARDLLQWMMTAIPQMLLQQ